MHLCISTDERPPITQALKWHHSYGFWNFYPFELLYENKGFHNRDLVQLRKTKFFPANISEAYLILFLRANLSVASSIEYLKNKLGIRIVFLSANKQSAFHWKILKEFK